MSRDRLEITAHDEEVDSEISYLNQEQQLALYVNAANELFLGEKPEGCHELIINDTEAFRSFAPLFKDQPKFSRN